MAEKSIGKNDLAGTAIGAGAGAAGGIIAGVITRYRIKNKFKKGK